MHLHETRTITITDYHKMIEAGILTEEERVELLAGHIVPMSPIGSKHAVCVKRLNHYLSQIVGQRAIISVQDPIELASDSEPEPDIALITPPFDRYVEAHPQVSDVFLIIEVAESSAQKDREVKLPLYAAAGIAEMWIVDLTEQVVEVYTEPKGSRYALRRLYQTGEQIEIGFLQASVAVSDILGA